MCFDNHHSTVVHLLPRSLMLKTPETVLLARRWRILASVGDAGSVESTAESTLESGSVTTEVSADMLLCKGVAKGKVR